MAQKRDQPKGAPEAILLPVQFQASIAPIANVRRVGDWIVGFSPEGKFHEDETGEVYDFTPGDMPKEWGFSRLPVEWLTSYLGLIKDQSTKGFSTPEAIDLIVRTLIDNGTFRDGDWIIVKKIVEGEPRYDSDSEQLPVESGTHYSFPPEVRDEIQRLNVRDGQMVYVMRIQDFWLEWQLIESLAVLAGHLSQKKSILIVRPDAERAWSLLQQLNSGRWGGTPRELPIHSERPLAEQTRLLVEEVVRTAFGRVMKKPEMIFTYSMKGGPHLALQAKSVLEIAYVILLRNFAHGWKRCNRPDCQRLFPITDDKRKVFCTQYCGHLESLRKTRKAAKQASRPSVRRKNHNRRKR